MDTLQAGREAATFIYDPGWVKRRGAIALSPTLPLTAGAFHSDRGLFTVFTDAAPDRWGQKLMRHHERARAVAAGGEPRKLNDIDFLVGVDDETRLGALRLKTAGGNSFLSQTGRPVPPSIDLRKLLSATDRIEKGKERKGDIALLLAPGGSLGGVRPKAIVRDKDRRLHLAKFPWKNDDWSVILWEKVTLDLAQTAGVDVPNFRLERVGTKSVLLIERFDRRDIDMRVPFMSAMTALGVRDREEDHSYLEIVDALRQMGSAPAPDIRQLWRRIVFNILVSNTDDHLRNHGFLWGPGGWQLAPAYDMNPSPMDVGGRVHVLAINDQDSIRLVGLGAVSGGLLWTSAAGCQNDCGRGRDGCGPVEGNRAGPKDPEIRDRAPSLGVRSQRSGASLGKSANRPAGGSNQGIGQDTACLSQP